MTIYICRKCGKFFNSGTLNECPFCREPVKTPKYAKHLTEKLTVQLDSVAFLCPNCGKYLISDRSKNENPEATVSFIKYPKENDRVQVHIAFSGKFHVEDLIYNVKPAVNWRETGWAVFNEKTAENVGEFLNWRNPNRLESWM